MSDGAATAAARGDRLHAYRHVPRTLRLVLRAAPGGVALLSALTLVTATLPPLAAWVGKRIVDAVVAGARDQVVRFIALEAVVLVVLTGLRRSLALVRQVLGSRLGLAVNGMILEKATRLELADFEDPTFYDQLTRARREASSRPLAVVSGVFDLGEAVVSLSLYLGLLLSYSPLIVAGLLFAALPATLAEVRLGQATFRARNWRSADARRLLYVERLLASDDAAQDVKLLGIGPLLLERYRALGESFHREDRALAVRRTAWAILLGVAATGVFYGAYASVALSAAAGTITLGAMTLYLVAFRQGQDALQKLLATAGAMHEHGLYLSNLFGYLDRPARPRRESPAETRPDGALLEIEGVGFRYPDRAAPALEGVSLTVAKGEMIAIVGKNGSGKSTLVKVLTGLYEPTEGEVRLSGVPLRSLSDARRFAGFAVLSQDFLHIKTTLRENVGFGSLPRMSDDDAIERALDRAGARQMVRDLPDGLETQLGRAFDRGVELSGGQWQSLGLARVFLRDEAPIVVLDEPTSALDAEAEAELFARVRELVRGRTAIVVSHRFSTVRAADRIVVLDRGRVVEVGAHDELVARGGLYARLYGLQASLYADSPDRRSEPSGSERTN